MIDKRSGRSELLKRLIIQVEQRRDRATRVRAILVQRQLADHVAAWRKRQWDLIEYHKKLANRIERSDAMAQRYKLADRHLVRDQKIADQIWQRLIDCEMAVV